MPIGDSIIAFAASVRADRAANPGIAGDGTALELLLAPRFRTLIEAILPEITAMPPAVLPEYERRGVGHPDLAFAQPASIVTAKTAVSVILMFMNIPPSNSPQKR